jgi:hypothetical protein
MSTSPELPAPVRVNGRLMFDRHTFENYKRSLLGLPLLERDPQMPIVLVPAKQAAAELPYGRRTLGRRIKEAESVSALATA